MAKSNKKPTRKSRMASGTANKAKKQQLAAAFATLKPATRPNSVEQRAG